MSKKIKQEEVRESGMSESFKICQNQRWTRWGKQDVLVNHALEQLKIYITWNLNRHAGKTELAKKIENYLKKNE